MKEKVDFCICNGIFCILHSAIEEEEITLTSPSLQKSSDKDRFCKLSHVIVDEIVEEEK